MTAHVKGHYQNEQQKWKYICHIMIGNGISVQTVKESLLALQKQKRQVYREYILVQLGHGQNNDMFLNMPIGRSLCRALALVCLTNCS